MGWLDWLLGWGWREKYQTSQGRVADLERLLEAQRKVTEAYSLLYDGAINLQQYYLNECSDLQRSLVEYKLALDKSLVVPSVNFDLASGKTVDAYGVPLLGGYGYRAADYEYRVYQKEKWVELCDAVYTEVKKVHPKWIQEVGDCNNYANTFNALVALAFRGSGAPKQGFFLTLWSRTHAYNGFVDDSLDVWILEPQSGRVIGQINEVDDPYVTRDVFLIV